MWVIPPVIYVEFFIVEKEKFRKEKETNMSDPSTEDPKLLYSKVQESFADDAQMLDCFSAFHASFLENLQCDNLKRNASGRALRWLSATEALSEQYAKPGGSRADKLSSSYETRRYLVVSEFVGLLCLVSLCIGCTKS